MEEKWYSSDEYYFTLDFVRWFDDDGEAWYTPVVSVVAFTEDDEIRYHFDLFPVSDPTRFAESFYRGLDGVAPCSDTNSVIVQDGCPNTEIVVNLE